MREYHVLNLGAGVQSTALYLLSREPDARFRFDLAIFADTGEEPAAVYRHMEYLQSLGEPPIWVRSAGKLGDDLIRGVNSTGQRFASIPAFTAEDHLLRPGSCDHRLPPAPKYGMLRRQCTAEYKIKVIEKAIRREIVGLKPRQRMPKDGRSAGLRRPRGRCRSTRSSTWAGRGRTAWRGWTAGSRTRFPGRPACSAPTGPTRSGCI